jgi:hypothetical protein
MTLKKKIKLRIINDKQLKNTKSEFRNSKQYRNSNDQNSKRFEHLNLEKLEFVSNFVLRASDLKKYGFQKHLRS